MEKDTKDKLRREIIETIKNVPEGQRVKIEKSVLENLLFETVAIDEGQIKLPVWSGDFLKKIDLSEVDFTNVSWNLLDESIIFRYFYIADSKTKAMCDAINNIRTQYNLGMASRVNYAETNANIDLTQSYEAIHGNMIKINKCDFTGVDFSKQNLTNIPKVEIYDSSIANTGLSIPTEAKLKVIGTDLSGIDLSFYKIDGNDYLSLFSDKPDVNLKGCNLANTNVQIVLDEEKLTNTIANLISQNFIVRLSYIAAAINKFWVGCYLNGKKITEENKKEIFSYSLNVVLEEMSKLTIYKEIYIQNMLITGEINPWKTNVSDDSVSKKKRQ